MKFQMIIIATFALIANAEEKKSINMSMLNPDTVLIEKNIDDWISSYNTNGNSIQKQKNTTYDALGRVVNGKTVNVMASTSNKDLLERRLILISDLTVADNDFEGFARYDYHSKDGAKTYKVNGNVVSEQQYKKFALQQEKVISDNYYSTARKIDLSKIDERRSIRWMTRTEISDLKKVGRGISISEYVEPKDLSSTASVLSLTQLSTHAFANSYNGNGIGIYFTESGCPNLNGVNVQKYIQGSTCIRGALRHPTGVAAVLQLASPGATIYGFDQVNYPTELQSLPVPVWIGSHSWAGSTDKIYTDEDMNMDNYIYNTRVTEFVAAGNKNSSILDYWVSSPGKALNAITVGAINPETNVYVNYSMWKNSEIGNEKPEVAMYTDIDFSNNSTMVGYYPNLGRFNGTSASTPLMAGFTGTILQQHPFFKGRPELIKALLISASTKSIGVRWDNDNISGVGAGIPLYSSAAWNTRSAYWEGKNSCCFDSNNEIKFIENNIEAGKQYRIAIAWLVPGTYIKANHSIPQDIDLFVYQNNTVIAKSTYVKNPFEYVNFVTSSASPLTVVIKRYSNSGQGKVILGYNLWENN